MVLLQDRRKSRKTVVSNVLKPGAVLHDLGHDRHRDRSGILVVTRSDWTWVEEAGDANAGGNVGLETKARLANFRIPVEEIFCGEVAEFVDDRVAGVVGLDQVGGIACKDVSGSGRREK